MDMELSALLTRAREAGLDERTIDLAEQGDATAQCDLAGCYIGLPYGNAERGELRWVRKKDDAEAVRWYRKAAEYGHAGAQFGLGSGYFLGRGVPEDYIKAHMWLSLAKTQSHEKAAKGLDVVKEKMTSAQIAKAQALATKWWEKNKN